MLIIVLSSQCVVVCEFCGSASSVIAAGKFIKRVTFNSQVHKEGWLAKTGSNNSVILSYIHFNTKSSLTLLLIGMEGQIFYPLKR